MKDQAIPSKDDVRDIGLVLQGYTISSRGSCMTRIGTDYVMRDSVRHCVRLPAAVHNSMTLSLAWAEFSRPTSERTVMSIHGEATRNALVHPKDTALVLQGYTAGGQGVCLARVVGNYVTRDGVHRCVRLLVDAVDPVVIGAAWKAFSGAAGWKIANARAEAVPSNRSVRQVAGPGEKRVASG